MTSLWEDEYLLLANIIKIVGVRSYWDGSIYYGSIGQTTPQNDPNLNGTNDTRSLAKHLLATRLVNQVKFSGGTVTISVNEGINSSGLFEISKSAIALLSRFKIRP